MTSQPDVTYELTRVQAQVLNTNATEIWYGGAAGGGKSHILRIIAILLCMEIPHLNVFLFRRKRPDLIRTHMKGPTSFPALLAKQIKAGIVKIVKDEIRFYHDSDKQVVSTILFCHCKDESDMYNYLSTDMHVTLNDEVSEFTEHMYRLQRSRARIPKSLQVPDWLKGRLPLTINASNPGGLLHMYLKEKFYDPVPPGVVWKAPEDDGSRLRVFIPAKLYDNPHIDHEQYAGNLKGLGSEQLVKMYLEGDMNVVLGAYFSEFGMQHIVKPFAIPHWWYRFRAVDWGYANHHCCLWGAISDGSIPGIERDAIVVYREQYDKEMVAEDVARRIVERTPKDEDIRFTVIDPSAYGQASKVIKGPNIAEVFATNGVPVRKADNERVSGWGQVKTRLQKEKLYMFETCRNLIRTLPLMEHDDLDPEDVKKKGMEDHCADTLRYLCMARPLVVDAPKSKGPLKSIDELSYAEIHDQIRDAERRARGY